MSTRFVAVGGLLAGLVIFAWGVLSDTLLPPPSALAAFMRDSTANLTPMLVRQLLTDVVTAMLLAFVLGMTPVRRYGSAAVFLGLVGLAAGIAQMFPLWNWYGFPADFALRGILDLMIGWMMAALVLVALRRGFEPAPQA